VAPRARARLSHRGGLRRDPRGPDAAPPRHSRRARVLMENYVVAMAVFAGLYALLALGLNVVWGMTGMINLGLVGFFGLGAYATALLTHAHRAPIVLGLAAAALVTAAAGAAMALTTARLRGDYLAIITLGFSEVVRLVASNELWLTNGTDGISGIPGPWRGRVTPPTFNVVYLAIVALAVLGAALVILLMEATRFATGWVGMLNPVQVAALREALIGGALLVVLRVRPRGLLPERLARS